jgi:hypothetical protein
MSPEVVIYDPGIFLLFNEFGFMITFLCPIRKGRAASIGFVRILQMLD